MLSQASRLFTFRLLAVAATLSALFFAAEARAQAEVNMTRGVTPVAHEVYDIHMFMLWICVAVGVLVFAYLLWTLIFHRKSAGREPAQFHEHLGAEIAWTVIPFCILVIMAIPATAKIKAIYDTSEAEIDIKVTGWQWKWQYEYLGEGVSFMSELATPNDQIYNLDAKGQNYLQEVTEPLVLPADTKVRFLVTAKDVIHAWWVPAFAIKRDAIPGYTVETWATVEQPGIYRGACAELCGQGHAFMPIVVDVRPKAEYAAWLAAKKQEAAAVAALKDKTYDMAESMELGQAVYERACAFCHGVNGEGGAGGAFPAMAGSPISLGDLRAHLDIVVNGSANNAAMQSFKDQLNEAEIAAVITYERNAFGNNTGDLVQPLDVYNFARGQ
ncbi:MAG: cytochrome c oxidase subunit II [Cellvibrionales bacterium]|nr:cytochrome c oxidase subunit II [Cellvibrionales bacterium]